MVSAGCQNPFVTVRQPHAITWPNVLISFLDHIEHQRGRIITHTPVTGLEMVKQEHCNENVGKGLASLRSVTDLRFIRAVLFRKPPVEPAAALTSPETGSVVSDRAATR